jgi:hypothetical protein
MVSRLMAVSEARAKRGAQLALTEEHELAQTLTLDGTPEALGVGVQVGTARRQAGRGDAGRGEEAQNWDV